MKFTPVCICVLLAASLGAQTVVEHSIATAGSSTAAAGMKDAGKSIGGVFQKLNQTLDKTAATRRSENAPGSGTPSASVVLTPAPSKEAATAISPSKPVDPAEVQEGLDRAALIERFGEPVFQVSERRKAQLVEKLWYNTSSPDQVEIQLIEGKVAAVRLPPARKQDAPRK